MGGCLIARAAGDDLVGDPGDKNVAGPLTAEQQIKQALIPLGYQPSTGVPDFSSVETMLVDAVGEGLPKLNSNFKELYQFCNNTIKNLNWGQFGSSLGNLFENFERGNDDGWVNTIFLAKTLNMKTPQSAANAYRNSNFKGTTGGAVAEVGYQLGQMLAAANLVTALIPAKAAASAALGKAGLVKNSLIKLPGGKAFFANLVKRNESIIESVKALSPSAQKEFLNSAWKFLQGSVSKFAMS